MAYWQHATHPQEYNAWNAMKVRCRNPRHPCYKDYGGRGIGVSEEWMSFPQFLADMGPRPSPTHSLDRRDNSRGYSADNCYWATKQEQSDNRRNVKRLECEGQVHTIPEWARLKGLSYYTLHNRLQRGIPLEVALNTPPDKRNRMQITP